MRFIFICGMGPKEALRVLRIDAPVGVVSSKGINEP
jgi:hypothetical protein